ncbi:hypothetical protein [Ancylobacter oerskovii]|uniref:Uncharacterized protein n=1 Tax=Ancylobacter oerskovii TaxID=459519 RepID=A0ABW4Z490_9HYPH|nr:hypothetical protein [Ancylobacter oerskovii]MBS7545738.1 hypothetical protein [Ancylobacter oerskovii]
MDEGGHQRGDAPGLSLREAIRAARVEAAEQAGVIVELRDASLVRLSMLNEILDPIFADVPLEHADLFDRGLMPGETPRLFVDMVAHITLGRDRRTFRFLQDTRSGRRVLAESTNPNDIADAVTRYVARRLIAREQAIATSTPPEAESPRPLPHHAPAPVAEPPPRGKGGTFLLGLVAGIAASLAGWLLLQGRF